MTFQTFTTTHGLKLSPKVESLCREGLARMAKTLDPTHDTSHIERLFDNLHVLLTEERSIDVASVNFEVLLLAVCWHDAWKAARVPGGLRVILFDDFLEGIGSVQHFKKAARSLGLARAVEQRTAYAIFAHTPLFLGQPKTLEALILRDIDRLDYWDLYRIRQLEAEYLERRKINRTLIRVAKWYFDYVARRRQAAYVYFTWSQKEFLTRKERCLIYLDQWIKQHRHLIRGL